MDKSESIKVVVRCRPMSKKEKEDGRQMVIEVDPKRSSITGYDPKRNNEKKDFTFDFTYSIESCQEQIFNETALPILSALMEGYNGTIFAYGQTGTGKTFTMEGEDTPDLKGIIPRTIEWIFDKIKQSSGTEFFVQASFVEIYKEEVRDLLIKDSGKLNIREKEGLFYVEGCKVIKVESPKEMFNIMNKGRENRKIAATLMNPGSSRSHSLFQIRVESSDIVDGETKYKIGKLNLVDLAGSERQSKTGATGKEQKEGISINLSLGTLGNVISALAGGKKGFVPYRESKLTMLLADSLGGNTKTVMIANVGPTDYNFDESINTLWYAARAKKIKNKPKINEDPKDALLRSYQEEIEIIKKQLASYGKTGVSPNSNLINTKSNSNLTSTKVEDEAAYKKMEENLEQEKYNFKKQKEEELKKINDEKNLAEEEKSKLRNKIEEEKEEYQKSKEEAKKLLEKLKNMKSKVLTSDEATKKVKEQEEAINKRKIELEAIEKEKVRLKKEFEEQNKKNFDVMKKYEDAQLHIDDLNNKIFLLKQEIEKIKSEKKESMERLQEEAMQLNETNKVFAMENSKKEFILKHFIPENEKTKISKCLKYNEKESEYTINRKAAIKNIYLSNRDIINKLKNNQRLDAGFGIYDSNGFKKKNNDFDNLELNLNFEIVEKLVSQFIGEPNPSFNKEVDHIIRDDDSDLIYYDKKLNMFDSSIIPFSDTGINIDNNISNSFLNSTLNSSIGKSIESLSNKKPVRISTGKKK